MKTRTWIVILGIVLLSCLGLSLFFLSGNDTATHARIVSDGQLIETVDLRLPREITVETEKGGVNVITVRDGEIAVTQANCPDHYCMHRGFCSGGAQIVCLPNGLVISFLSQEQDVDMVVG